MPPQKKDDFEPDDFEADDFEPAQPEEKSWLSKALDYYNKSWFANPLTTKPSEFARSISSKREPEHELEYAKLNEHIPGLGTGLSRYEGFMRGATEGLGDTITSLTSPQNLILSGLGLGEYGAAERGLANTTRALTAARRAVSVPGALQSAGEVVDHSGKKEYGQAALAAAGLAGYGAGIFSPPPAVKFPIKVSDVPFGPERFAPKGLLPEAPRERFIAGPGGVQRESLVTPQESARLQGFEFGLDDNGNIVPVGRESGPAPRFTDLGELAEAERQKNTFYTGHEQQGGTALELPDRGLEQPPLPGSTNFGFNPVARTGGLPYPLDFIPEAVRPRSTQAVTQALAGEENAKSTLRPGEPIEFESAKPPKETPEGPVDYGVRGGTAAIRPQEVLLPGAVKTLREARKNTGLNITPELLDNSPEPIKSAVIQMTENESKLPSPWKSVYTQLEQQSPELAMRAKRAVHRTRQYLSQWAPDFEAAIGKLKKEQKANFGAYAEGTLPITDAKVQVAVNIWKTIESAIGDKATDVGLRLFSDSKKWVPFIKNTENYWPHIPQEKVGPSFVQKLVDSGMSLTEAQRVQKFFRKSGELVVGAQHARAVKSNIPYRLDADAGIAHIYSMAKRIAQHEEFGPLDTAGKGNEGVADIINATKNPTLTNKLMERIVGRDEVANATLTKWLDRSRRFAAIAHLQNFTIPNMILGQGMTALKAARYPVAAVKETMNLFSSRYRTDLAKSGIWQNFNHTIAEEVGKFKDPYLIGTGELVNRGIAGAVGKAVAREALAELKRKPNSKIARAELSELVLEDPDIVSRQSELTNAQLNMAAGRMAERTQGLNVPGNLPYDWSSPVNDGWRFGGQLVLQFKKMGYQATKNVWDSIDPRKVGIANSAKNMSLWLAISQVVGELTGDVKQGVRSLWQTDPDDRREKWLAGNGITPPMIQSVSDASGVPPEVVARMLDNASNAFFLGLPADMLMSASYGPQGLTSAIAGPVIGDLSKFAYYGTNPKQLGKEAVKMAPIPGSQGLANRIFSED